MLKNQNKKIIILRNQNIIETESESNFQIPIEEHIERLSLMIKKQKINANYIQNKKNEELPNLMKLNELNLNIIQYILSKKKRNNNELLIIKEFLSSLKIFDNHTLDVNQDKLLFSLSSFLKMEKRPESSLLFRYGDKGSKFYIVIKGELSVLIVKETKIELNAVDYFIHLLLLKTLKEEELLKKTLLANCKIGLKMDEINFEDNYEKLIKFFNKNFKVKIKRNINTIEKTKKAHFDFVNKRPDIIKDMKNSIRRKSTIVMKALVQKVEGNLPLNTEKDEKIIDDEQYDMNKYRKSDIFNNIILKKKDDIFFSELELYNFELYELNKIVSYFIKIKENSIFKRYYSSIDDYIETTYIFPEFIRPEININFKYIKKDIYSVYKYFQIDKKKVGDIFGELALLHNDNKRTGTIITQTDCILGFLSREDYNNSLHDIEVKKRQNQVNFIMSFSIFDKMNFNFFETKFFNYFIRETFIKDSYILRQGDKCDKIYFIMEGIFELTTTLNLDTIKNFIRIKSKDHPKYMNDLYLIKSLEPLGKKKNYTFKLSIIENKDIVGLDDYIMSDDISFVNVKCISFEGIVYSIERNLLLNLKEKIVEIDNNLKHIIKKRLDIIIQKLIVIFKVILNNPNVGTRKISLSDEFNKKRVKSALLNKSSSLTNHIKLKNLLSDSQRYLLEKDDNKDEIGNSNIANKYKYNSNYSKEINIKDNDMNSKDGKMNENSMIKKRMKKGVSNFLDSIENSFKQIKKKKMIFMNDLYNPFGLSSKDTINYKTSNKGIIDTRLLQDSNFFNKKSNLKQKILDNKLMQSSYIKNRNKGNNLYINLKNYEIKSTNIYRNAIRRNIANSLTTIPRLNTQTNSYNNKNLIDSSNISDMNNLFPSNANENYSTCNSKKENEKEINLHIIKDKKNQLDKGNKYISKYKEISPENYLKIILGTRFKKHEINVGEKIISKQLLKNEKIIDKFLAHRKKNFKVKNSVPIKKNKTINLSEKNKNLHKIKRFYSKESPIVDFLLYNTLISKNSVK